MRLFNLIQCDKDVLEWEMNGETKITYIKEPQIEEEMHFLFTARAANCSMGHNIVKE